VLTLIAAVILTIPRSHGQRIFDLVMGLNRWCYRVLCLRRPDNRRISAVPARHWRISGPGLDGQITRYRAHATPSPINQICSANSLSRTKPMAAPNGG
jgi:hypothetical protein